MRRLIPLLALACTPQEKPIAEKQDIDTDGDDDTDIVYECDARLDTIIPADLTTNVDCDEMVLVTFTDRAYEGQWTLGIVDVNGTAELSDDGMSATFVPDEPLDYDTIYTVEATACEDEAETRFWTVLEPVDLDTLDDRTYVMPYGDLVWVEPASSVALHPFVTFESFLMEVSDVYPTVNALDTRFTAGWSQGVPECGSIVDTSADYTNNPTFVTGSSSLYIPIPTSAPPTTLTIEDLRVEASFANQGTSIVNVVMKGMLDTRGFDPLLGSNTCLLAAAFGDICQACLDGENRCLPVHVTLEEAQWNPLYSISAYCP